MKRRKKGLLVTVERIFKYRCEVSTRSLTLDSGEDYTTLRRMGLTPLKQGEKRRVRLVIEEGV